MRSADEIEAYLREQGVRHVERVERHRLRTRSRFGRHAPLDIAWTPGTPAAAIVQATTVRVAERHRAALAAELAKVAERARPAVLEVDDDGAVALRLDVLADHAGELSAEALVRGVTLAVQTVERLLPALQGARARAEREERLAMTRLWGAYVD